jgi:hypothetical protein
LNCNESTIRLHGLPDYQRKCSGKALYLLVFEMSHLESLRLTISLNQVRHDKTPEDQGPAPSIEQLPPTESCHTETTNLLYVYL